jgi:hypothetical protein
LFGGATQYSTHAKSSLVETTSTGRQTRHRLVVGVRFRKGSDSVKRIDEFTVELDDSDCHARIAEMAALLGITVEQAMTMSHDELSPTLAGVHVLQMRFLLGE